MAAKHPHILRTTCTATALSVMLAACGGGGGSERDKAVSASPVAPTPAQNIVATAPTTPSVTTPSVTTPSVTTPQNNPVSTGQVNTPAVGQPNSVQPAPSAPQTPGASQNQTTTLPPTTLAPTQPVAQVDTKPAPTPAPAPEPKTVPNISGKGVRGDVLLAMMEQNYCQTRAYASQSFDKPYLEKQKPLGIAKVRISAEFSSNNYVDDPNRLPVRAPISDIYGLCSQRYYHATPPGTYVYKVTSYSEYSRFRNPSMYGEAWLTRGFNTMGINYTINIREDSFEIGPSAMGYTSEDLEYKKSADGDTPPPSGSGTSLPFLGGKRTLITRSHEVPYGVISNWDDNLQLMLIKGNRKDEAKICTSLNSTYVKRLQCTVWHVPSDWKWGQELKDPESYVVDDRSVYPNESGLMYWRSYQGPYVQDLDDLYS